MGKVLRTGVSSTLAAMLMIAGCSDDESTPATNTIVDVAVANGNFTILTAALTRAGLVDDLQGTGPFTVFAPTDAAFAASGITLNDVNTMPVDELDDILLYHVVSGEVGSSQVPARANALSGITLLFDTTSGVQVNDATVVTADVQADNGVIHVIDSVLIPPDIAAMAGHAGLTELLTVVGAASAIPQGTALTPSGTLAIGAALASPDVDLTVFAPTNAAFDAIASVAATLTEDQLRDVLLYHVIGSPVTSSQLTNGDVATLLDLLGAASPDLTVSTTGPTVTGCGNTAAANIGPADIVATNGVIHLVDAVLLPIGSSCP